MMMMIGIGWSISTKKELKALFQAQNEEYRLLNKFTELYWTKLKMNQLRVVSFNVEKVKYPQQIERDIREMNPDIIILQEVKPKNVQWLTTTFGSKYYSMVSFAHRPGFNHGKITTRVGNAILSRFPITHQRTYKLLEYFPYSRIALDVYFFLIE